MCWDDHLYCGTCGKHALACYCFLSRDPDPEDDVCMLAAEIGGFGHEGTGT